MNLSLSSLQKKIIASVGLLVVAGFFGFLIYFLFFKPPAEEYVNVNGNMIPVSVFPEINLNLNKGTGNANANTNVGLPQISPVADGGNTLAETVSEDAAQDSTLSGDGKGEQYYNAADGIFYRIDENGNRVALTDKIFKGVTKTTWANDKNKAVLQFEDGSNLYYDFQKKQQYTLPKEMKEFTFSPGSDKIGYKYMATDVEDRWLGTINPDGSDPKGIERLGDNEDKVQMSWSPSGKAVATLNDYIDADRQKVIPIGLNGENYKQMTVEGRDFKYQWSPTGKQMLYSVFGAYSDYKPTLWIVDSEGDDIGKNRKPLEIDTWVDKCTFSDSSSVYCAVPQTLPTGVGYSRSLADETPDMIYQIDINTGKKKLIAIPTDSFGTLNYTIESLSVSKDGSTLFFTDKANKNIHKLKLK